MRTAEAVSPGHPDKICDQISDAILDNVLNQDKDSRVAIECLGGHGIVTITGELTTKAYVDMAKVAKQVYKDAGYNDEIGVQVNVVSQSPDIAQGVDNGGAGDQGIMVGYACNDNEEMIPQELYLARKALKAVLGLASLPCGIFGPDGKTQVTLDDDNYINRLVISVQHQKGMENEARRAIENEFRHGKWGKLLSKDAEIIVNGTGKFEIGGFAADTGVTGRKIVNDAYGPQVPVGGGAFSGKDPSKVDRSAAYMARKIAVDLLKNSNTNETAVEVKLAYSIGIAEPLMAVARFYHGEQFNEMNLKHISNYDLTPKGIIDFLKLKEPIYKETAKWGAYGNKKFNWEK